MSERFRCGLVVGKFSPLHRGHQLVVERAFSICREVLIVSYAKPERPGCEAATRERWLAELFPAARCLVVDDDRLARLTGTRAAFREVPADAEDATLHRRFVGWLCRDLLDARPDAVFTSEDYGPGFADELTRFFRRDDPTAPAVSHVPVDRARRTVPISASAILDDLDGGRRWLPPCVRASFVYRICVLGGESSGKTTLAEALARSLATEWVAEYGRERWLARGGSLDYEDLLHIARVQVEREDAAARRVDRWLVCDTSPLTTLFYSLRWFGRAADELISLAKRPYHLVVLCAPDFPFEQDGTRQPAAFRDEQHVWYVHELESRRVPYLLASGPTQQRVDAVTARLRPR